MQGKDCEALFVTQLPKPVILWNTFLAQNETIIDYKSQSIMLRDEYERHESSHEKYTIFVPRASCKK